jgi:hypothetical protein
MTMIRVVVTTGNRRFQYYASTNILEEIKPGGKTVEKMGYIEDIDGTGWEIDSKKGRATLTKYLDEDYENSIEVTFVQDKKLEAMTVFIVLTEAVGPRVLYGFSPGLCAGGGQTQLQSATQRFKNIAHKEGHSGKMAKLGFACEKCTIGLGSVGAMCPCKEWSRGPDNQLFVTKYARGFKRHMDAKSVNLANVAKNKKKCKSFLLSHPAGKMFYTGKMKKAMRPSLYKQMNKLFRYDIEDCALDKAAGMAKNAKGQRDALAQAFCWTTALQTPRKKNQDNKLLCEMISKCMGNGLRSAPMYIPERSHEEKPKCRS